MENRDDWKVVAYEVEMLRELYDLLASEELDREHARVIRNALVESACLHTRILVDVLLSKGSRDDDINLKDFWEESPKSESVKLLARAYGSEPRKSREDPTKPYWKFNKLLAHPTTHRKSSHDYAQTLKALYPYIKLVWDEVPGTVAKPSIVVRKWEANSVYNPINMYMYGKTSS